MEDVSRAFEKGETLGFMKVLVDRDSRQFLGASILGVGGDEVIHTIAPDNASSKAVAAKLGSRYRGMGRLPEPHHEKPVEIWGQTRAEWRARREQSA